MEEKTIIIYTDGSCNPKNGIGAWATIIFINEEKIILEGSSRDTTHQRMELVAVIEAFNHVLKNNLSSSQVIVYTDSQYVTGLSARKKKLRAKDYQTKRNGAFPNADLMSLLIDLSEKLKVRFVKVKAHQNLEEENYNREVDLLARKNVRRLVDQSS